MRESVLSVITNFIKNRRAFFEQDKKIDSIFYDIVAYDHKEKRCTLKCINTVNQFVLTIQQIVFDEDILYFLHPVHACFIGIEFARFAKSGYLNAQNHDMSQYRKDPINRYGLYEVLYKDRKGNICFSRLNHDKQFVMDPRDIVLSNDLIQEFDASQAFYIGLEAGFKIDTQHGVDESQKEFKKPNLTIVKK